MAELEELSKSLEQSYKTQQELAAKASRFISLAQSHEDIQYDEDRYFLTTVDLKLRSDRVEDRIYDAWIQTINARSRTDAYFHRIRDQLEGLEDASEDYKDIREKYETFQDIYIELNEEVREVSDQIENIELHRPNPQNVAIPQTDNLTEEHTMDTAPPENWVVNRSTD